MDLARLVYITLSKVSDYLTLISKIQERNILVFNILTFKTPYIRLNSLTYLPFWDDNYLIVPIHALVI